MLKEACADATVTYSEGDYGRPLLHAEDAGRAVVMVAKARLEGGEGSRPHFEVILIPGKFTSFGEFADTVVAEMGEAAGVKKKKQGETPDFLKSRCVGLQRLKDLGFEPDRDLVAKGLKETAWYAINAAR